MKIAVITDSNSGITQEQAKSQGLYVLPMPFMINGETFYEDIDLTQKEFYEKLTDGAEISTSQPSVDAILDLWEELLDEYDQIVHIPMSSNLSGACQTAQMLSRDYGDRVFVVDNQRISVTQRQSALDAKRMADMGAAGNTIKERLEREKLDASIYITVDTLRYLKKGGRITPAAAALGTLLKIKPVLTIQGGKLDAFAKARTTRQAVSTMISAIGRDLEVRFQDVLCRNTYLQVAHSDNEEAAINLSGELKGMFPEAEIYVDHLSLSVACHTGPGALAIACTKKMLADGREI